MTNTTNPTSYAVFCLFKNEPASTNGLRFATRDEADAYGSDLLSRWFMPTGYDVRGTDDAVTHTFVDGKSVRVTA